MCVDSGSRFLPFPLRQPLGQRHLLTNDVRSFRHQFYASHFSGHAPELDAYTFKRNSEGEMMADPIDDAFAAAERRAADRKREREDAERRRIIIATHGAPLAQSIVEAIRRKVERFNEHPRNTNQVAIMPGTTDIALRRAAQLHMKDRALKVQYRPDSAKLSWRYDAAGDLVRGQYEPVASGEVLFEITGEGTLIAHGGASPEGVADEIVGDYLRDCATDMAEAKTNEGRL